MWVAVENGSSMVVGDTIFTIHLLFHHVLRSRQASFTEPLYVIVFQLYWIHAFSMKVGQAIYVESCMVFYLSIMWDGVDVLNFDF